MWYDTRRQIMQFYKKMQRSPWRYIVMVALGLFVIYIFFFRSSNINLPGGVELSKYEPFEPVANTDFHNGTSNEAKIPKIIHWFSKDTTVKKEYEDNIRSFAELNPGWQFYIWTYENFRQLLTDSQPEQLNFWDGHAEFFGIRERRLEIMQYVVLYIFGGIVLDMSARNYRPLDLAVSKYSCIVPPNPYEEAIITGVPYTISNRIMMCRPRHPFLKFVVENLHRYQHMSTQYDAVGEGFLLAHYQLYNALQRERDDKNIYIPQNRKDVMDTSPYFFQGEFTSTHPDAVYVPNTVYFTGSSNQCYHSVYIKTCSDFFTAPILHKRACVHLHRRGMKRVQGQFAFTDLENCKRPLFTWYIDIRRIVPQINLYK